MEKNLLGKVALITGAESGIGAAIAIAFANAGCDVVLTYFNNEAQAREIHQKIETLGVKGVLVKTDVRNENEVINLFLEALKTFPKIDFLVNSAGVRSKDKYLADMTFEEFKHTLDTNLIGAFLCCKYFVNHYPADAVGGRIINITSIHSEIVSAGKTDYCASKFALKGFSKALSLELAAKQITVNCIAPGMILTPMNQQAIDNPAYRNELAQRIPLQYAGLPADVAHVAIFLASENARYITGTTQIVDGGLMLNRNKGAK